MDGGGGPDGGLMGIVRGVSLACIVRMLFLTPSELER